MKKLKKAITTIKDVLIILGIPTIGYYAYQVHVEQINTKEQQIELLNIRISTLQDSQVENVWEKYQSLKAYSEEQIKDLSTNLAERQFLYDSLQNYLKGAVWEDSTRMSITLADARMLFEDAVKKRYGDTLIMILEKQVQLQDEYRKFQQYYIHQLTAQNDGFRKELRRAGELLRKSSELLESAPR